MKKKLRNEEKTYHIKVRPQPILNCHCGGKYIKTREGQTECLLCIRLKNQTSH